MLILCAIGIGLQHHFVEKASFTIKMIGIKLQPIFAQKACGTTASHFVDLYEIDLFKRRDDLRKGRLQSGLAQLLNSYTKPHLTKRWKIILFLRTNPPHFRGNWTKDTK